MIQHQTTEEPPPLVAIVIAEIQIRMEEISTSADGQAASGEAVALLAREVAQARLLRDYGLHPDDVGLQEVLDREIEQGSSWLKTQAPERLRDVLAYLDGRLEQLQHALPSAASPPGHAMDGAYDWLQERHHIALMLDALEPAGMEGVQPLDSRLRDLDTLALQRLARSGLLPSELDEQRVEWGITLGAQGRMSFMEKCVRALPPTPFDGEEFPMPDAESPLMDRIAEAQMARLEELEAIAPASRAPLAMARAKERVASAGTGAEGADASWQRAAQKVIDWLGLPTLDQLLPAATPLAAATGDCYERRTVSELGGRGEVAVDVVDGSVVVQVGIDDRTDLSRIPSLVSDDDRVVPSEIVGADAYWFHLGSPESVKGRRYVLEVTFRDRRETVWLPPESPISPPDSRG